MLGTSWLFGTVTTQQSSTTSAAGQEQADFSQQYFKIMEDAEAKPDFEVDSSKKSVVKPKVEKKVEAPAETEAADEAADSTEA